MQDADSIQLSHSATNDELHLVKLAQQDPAAFAPLYMHYHPIMFGYCLNRFSDRELAADTTSQIFLRALHALPKFKPDPSRPGSTFRAWLFTIAHNLIVDTRRRARTNVSLDAPAREGSSDFAESLLMIDPAPSPEDQVLAIERRDFVRQVLRQLPEQHRHIIELRLSGLTGLEIAEALGMTISAVKSAQFRAYGKLRDLLDAHPSNSETPHDF